MKLRTGAYLFMMFGLAILMTACGGGGGGGGAAGTLITVTSAKNPVLVNTPVTVTANFTNYTSTVKFGANKATVGSAVHFSVDKPAGVLTSPSAVKADYTATVDLTAPAGSYTVTASFNGAAGSTTVAFIPQPGSARVTIAPQTALTGVGYMQCDVTNDIASVFRQFSTAKGATLFPANNPPTGGSVFRATGSLLGSAGYNLAAAPPSASIYPLFKFSYNMTALPGVPNFAVDLTPYPSVGQYFVGVTDILPVPVLVMKATYFSGPNETGTQLYP